MFSLNVIGYLFLGGVGGGMGLVSSVVAFLALREKGPESFKTCRSLMDACHCTAAVVLMCGCFLLVADLGRPDRVLVLLTSPTMTFLFAGTVALVTGVALNFVLALIWNDLLSGVRQWAFVLEAVLMAVSVFIMLYTGLLLSSLNAVPFWHSPWLPVLFFLSACSCGMAAVLIVGQFRGCIANFPVLFERMLLADSVLIVLEALAAAVFVWAALNAGGATPSQEAAAMAAESLVKGQFARLFWVSFVVCGMLVPFLLEVVSFLLGKVEHRSPYVVLWTAALVLAGGLFMRLGVVAAGMHPALIFGA